MRSDYIRIQDKTTLRTQAFPTYQVSRHEAQLQPNNLYHVRASFVWERDYTRYNTRSGACMRTRLVPYPTNSRFGGEQSLEVTIKHLYLYTDSMQSNSYTDCKAARFLNSHTLVTQAFLLPATGDNTPKEVPSSGILSPIIRGRYTYRNKGLIRFYS